MHVHCTATLKVLKQMVGRTVKFIFFVRGFG